jgi:hypothetical protein
LRNHIEQWRKKNAKRLKQTQHLLSSAWLSYETEHFFLRAPLSLARLSLLTVCHVGCACFFLHASFIDPIPFYLVWQGPDQSTLIQPGDLTLDTKRNKLVIPSMDLFNTDSNVYYTVDLATANWEGFPVQTLETVTANPEFATIKEFSSSWLSTPNAITYDAKNDRYLTTTGTSNRIERKIKIREPDSPYEEAGQISAWNAETSVLVSDLFGGCPQSWDSVVVDDLMYTASFMGWVCVMNLTDFNNGPNIGEKLLTGHNINGIAYDKKRELLWVTEVGTQGGNTRITHTQPSAPKDTFTAMIVAIDINTRKVVAQTNVSNHNFFPVSLAVNPATNNLIVGNTAAQIRTTDFGGLVECIPDEGYFVTCVGIPATAVITATNQFVLGVEFAADGLAYFSAMNLEQNDPKAILYRLNGDVVETLVVSHVTPSTYLQFFHILSCTQNMRETRYRAHLESVKHIIGMRLGETHHQCKTHH